MGSCENKNEPFPPIRWACLKFIIPLTAKANNRLTYLMFSEFLLDEFQNAPIKFIVLFTIGDKQSRLLWEHNVMK